MQGLNEKIKVILVTDGDQVAQKTIEIATHNIGGRCISTSAGNPTPISGPRIIDLIKEAANEPVVVMFDDNGSTKRGKGEEALSYVANHPDLEVMGVLAVASNSGDAEVAHVDCAITKDKLVVEGQVNKEGNLISDQKVISGDTINVINELTQTGEIYTVGIGDLGKMEGYDNPYTGAEVTTKAMQEIMDHWEKKQRETVY
ncbi:MAG: stage V sporulation protein AE [Firmicutes bacterium HGW-Firmicutes-12]|nr:MAG: stage V sporulation protein AE [Firmicutes bacterium HGW-Firmicutes-12]